MKFNCPHTIRAYLSRKRFLTGHLPPLFIQTISLHHTVGARFKFCETKAQRNRRLGGKNKLLIDVLPFILLIFRRARIYECGSFIHLKMITWNTFFYFFESLLIMKRFWHNYCKYLILIKKKKKNSYLEIPFYCTSCILAVFGISYSIKICNLWIFWDSGVGIFLYL
jgi:hypothetical protein